MSDNLIELALKELGSNGLDALGSALGLPSGQAQPAAATGMASVLAGMLNKSSSKTGLAALFSMITEAREVDFSNIGDVFSDAGSMSSLQKQGGNILDSIFGPKAGDVGDILGSALNMGKGGGSLLSAAAPVVMTLLKRLMHSRSLDVSAFGKFLFSQRSNIKGLLPDGLLSAIGVHDFEDLGQQLETHGHAQPQSARMHHVKPEKRGGFGKWLWPLLIALGVLYALSMCSKKTEMESAPGGMVIDETAVTVTDFGSSLRDYLANAARDPNREFPLTIEFAVDSAELTSESVPDVETLAAILKDNPAVMIAIEGHTSSEGDENRNMTLSQQRADAVKQMLVGMGVDGNRITATGKGSSSPVADNSTEEGKQKNRRIAVKVTAFE